MPSPLLCTLVEEQEVIGDYAHHSVAATEVTSDYAHGSVAVAEVTGDNARGSAMAEVDV
jgi:hypothetical protein